MTNEDLARYFTNYNVGRHSVGLQMDEGSKIRADAEAFYALRKKFGIEGYVSYETALIRLNLFDEMISNVLKFAK